jgi:phosphatidylserine decarboxylase
VKHSEKAALTARKFVGLAFVALLLLLAVAFLGKNPVVMDCLAWVLIPLCGLFVGFTLYFFRDPNPVVPGGANLVVSPGHGKVDVIDTTAEPDFMGGECRRVSIFLSVFDVHVQNAPVTGRVALFKHTPGKYLNAMRTDSAKFNENVLIGINAGEPSGEKIGVRLIAGLIARRIVPWVAQNDDLQRGDRISLIQFGSRVDLYLPLRAKIRVKLGDRVVGGETVIASFD